MVASCSEVAVGHACPVKAKYTASQWLVTVTRSSLVWRRDYGEEWAFVAPYLTLMSPEASHRVYALREVVSVLRWIVRGEAPWRLLATNVRTRSGNLLPEARPDSRRTPAIHFRLRRGAGIDVPPAVLSGRDALPRLSSAPSPSNPGASIGRILSCLRTCIA
jgi:hypothetical protein